MNGRFSIPTGKGRYPRDPAAFEQVDLSDEECLAIKSHPRFKEATSITLFTRTGDDLVKVEAIANKLSEVAEFKGEVRKMVARTGATIFLLVKRADLNIDKLYAALVEKPA